MNFFLLNDLKYPLTIISAAALEAEYGLVGFKGSSSEKGSSIFSPYTSSVLKWNSIGLLLQFKGLFFIKSAKSSTTVDFCASVGITLSRVVKKVINNNNVSAVILETIQGEGGIRIAEDKFLKEIRKITSQKDILLIVDEVQTGMGRTGKWFSYQHANIKPDIVTCAKGLGNGVPIGACLGNKKASNLFTPGSHGSTFGGNPLVCSVSSKVIDVIEKNKLCKQSENIGNYLINEIKNKVQDLSVVKEVRGKGLMIGIEINICLLYTSPSPRDRQKSRMPSSA